MVGPVTFPLVRNSRRGATVPTVLLVALCVTGLLMTRANLRPDLMPASSCPTAIEYESQPVNWPATMIHLWFLVPQFLPYDS